MHITDMAQEIDIKKLRLERKWTQSAMAEHFGVDKATVWRWENIGIPERGASRKSLEREWEGISTQAEVTQ